MNALCIATRGIICRGASISDDLHRYGGGGGIIYRDRLTKKPSKEDLLKLFPEIKVKFIDEKTEDTIKIEITEIVSVEPI